MDSTLTLSARRAHRRAHRNSARRSWVTAFSLTPEGATTVSTTAAAKTNDAESTIFQISPPSKSVTEATLAATASSAALSSEEVGLEDERAVLHNAETIIGATEEDATTLSLYTSGIELGNPAKRAKGDDGAIHSVSPSEDPRTYRTEAQVPIEIDTVDSDHQGTHEVICLHLSQSSQNEQRNSDIDQQETKHGSIEVALIDQHPRENPKKNENGLGTPQLKTLSNSKRQKNPETIGTKEVANKAALRQAGAVIISTVSTEGEEAVAVLCSICETNLASMDEKSRADHEAVCQADKHLDRMQRRNYRCPVCDLDLASTRVSESALTRRLRHLRVCAKSNGISDPRQFARISNRGDEAKDDECDAGDENFEALMDAIFDEDDDEDEENQVNMNTMRMGMRGQPVSNSNSSDNAFTMMMKSAKEPRKVSRQKSMTSTVKTAARKSWYGKSSGSYSAPPAKNQVPDCAGFIVDGFRYRFARHTNVFFLTHFHADHYGGIAYKWDEAPIYCTPTTARLLAMRFKVNPRCINQIEIGGPPVRVKGAEVLALDANHCPGAAMFLFKVRKTKKLHLHTGDIRYDRTRIDLTKTLRIPRGFHLETIFLDTTYLDPSCRFITQQQAISQAAELVSKALQVESNNALTAAVGLNSAKSTLIVVGAYTIGKERFLWGILRACFPEKEKVYVSPAKFRVLKCLEDLKLNDLLRLTTDKSKARVHLVEMGKLSMPSLRGMLGTRYARIVALRPTGHARQITDTTSQDRRIRIISVPYSEHSSYTELEQFIADVRTIAIDQSPMTFVPTVQSVGSKRGGISATKSVLAEIILGKASSSSSSSLSSV